jgi:plasmid replication initiation protein
MGGLKLENNDVQPVRYFFLIDQRHHMFSPLRLVTFLLRLFQLLRRIHPQSVHIAFSPPTLPANKRFAWFSHLIPDSENWKSVGVQVIPHP